MQQAFGARSEMALPSATLIVGNCVDVMRSWPDNIVNLTVTSPPYDKLRDYKGYDFPFEEIADELYRVTALGGVLVWIVGDRINKGRSLTSFRQAIYFQEIGFSAHDIMIYQKKNTPFMRSNAYTNAYEMMFVLSKGKPATFNPLKEPTQRQGFEMLPHNKLRDVINKKSLKELKKEKTRTNIWSYAVGLGGTTNDRIAFQHPAVFPEKLALDHILSWSNPGDLILDPMSGSGTTGKMALLQSRRFIGIDISAEYTEIARQRLADCGLPVDAPQHAQTGKVSQLMEKFLCQAGSLCYLPQRRRGRRDIVKNVLEYNCYNTGLADYFCD